MNEIYGLTREQWLINGKIARDFRAPGFEAPTVEPANRRSASVARLMTVGKTFPIYNPLETRKAALFELSRQTLQATVKFYGENLWGDVLISVGGVTAQVDCRATTEQLRAALQSVTQCRISVFPGLWEFAFEDGVDELPVITCEPVVTSNNRRFLGGCLVVKEGWRSVSVDGDTFSQVDVIDSIPYLQGEVKLGAMSIGTRYGAGLYLCGQWSCPAFTFRSL